MKSYKNIFFDLDRTLWDFDTNSSETLAEIMEKFSLSDQIDDVNEFIRTYNYYNDRLWDYYREGKIKKFELRRERFRLSLNRFGIQNNSLTEKINQYYMNACPVKTALIPNAKETVEYLAQKYKLHIISNGFYDVQLTKLVNSGISRYFGKVFTSDRIGYAKPDVRIFEYAIKSLHAHKEESLMIGDDLKNDIEGAKNAKIDQVLFNIEPNTKSVSATYIISDLKELKELL